MSTDVAVSIFEVVGSSLCVASGDGQKVYDRIAALLEQDQRVLLSFRNVSTLTSAFSTQRSVNYMAPSPKTRFALC